jgi:hypothetical protein
MNKPLPVTMFFAMIEFLNIYDFFSILQVTMVIETTIFVKLETAMSGI